jgi:hypothetical protein
MASESCIGGKGDGVPHPGVQALPLHVMHQLEIHKSEYVLYA